MPASRQRLTPPTSAVVFGASGRIGSALLRRLQQEGWSVIGTYARRPTQGLVRFDLTDTAPPDIDLQHYRYGIIFSAVCDIDTCKRDPETAARVNVDGTKRLIDRLAASGVQPVFVSSDYVYDGRKGGYTEDDPPAPNTEYGRQKATVEKYLQTNFPESLAVRLSKVFTADPGDGTMLAEWYRRIGRGEPIRNDPKQRFCPTCCHDVTGGLLALLQLDASGLFNLCQPHPYTRGEFLSEFLEALGLAYENVEEWDTERFGFLDNRPGDISLDPGKFVRRTGYRFTPMKTIFERFRRNLDRDRAE